MPITIAAVSDIHGQWDCLNYPEADVLIFAGDILRNYSRSRIHDSLQQLNEIKLLNEFIGKLKQDLYKEVIIVAGNHDYAFQDLPEAREAFTNAHYLQDDEIIIDGVKFYGSPWQPWFWDWAFNFPNHNENYARAKAHAQRTWALVPKDTNVLITHGPPRGTLDMCYTGEHVGCVWMEERLQELKQIKLHVFGHIHFSYGQRITGGLGEKRIYANVAACDEAYQPINPIQTFEVNREEEKTESTSLEEGAKASSEKTEEGSSPEEGIEYPSQPSGK